MWNRTPVSVENENDGENTYRTEEGTPLFIKNGKVLDLESLGLPAGLTLYPEEVVGAKVDYDQVSRVRIYTRNGGFVASSPLECDEAQKTVIKINEWCNSKGLAGLSQ